MSDTKKIISVISASSGAGGTFIAVKLALEMGRQGKKTTFLEEQLCNCPRCLRKPLIYYDIDLFKRKRGRPFVDFYLEKSKGNPIDNKVNFHAGVNWIIRTPLSPVCKITPKDVGGEYIIWDNPEDIGKSTVIICVVKAQYNHVAAALPMLKKLKENYSQKVLWLLNGDCKKSEISGLEALLGKRIDYMVTAEENHADEIVKDIAQYIITLY